MEQDELDYKPEYLDLNEEVSEEEREPEVMKKRVMRGRSYAGWGCG